MTFGDVLIDLGNAINYLDRTYFAGAATVIFLFVVIIVVLVYVYRLKTSVSDWEKNQTRWVRDLERWGERIEVRYETARCNYDSLHAEYSDHFRQISDLCNQSMAMNRALFDFAGELERQLKGLDQEPCIEWPNFPGQEELESEFGKERALEAWDKVMTSARKRAEDEIAKYRALTPEDRAKYILRQDRDQREDKI